MNINDGSVKVLTVDYGQPGNPNIIAIGYSFQNTPYSIKDFASMVANLNKTAGWHYRDVQVNIQGNMYTIAEVYEEEKPLKEVYPTEPVTDQNQLNKLFQSLLPASNLGISQELMSYTPQPKVEQTQNNMGGWDEAIPKITEQQSNSKSKYLEYMTEEELAQFGNPDDLSDNELQKLEDFYDQRKGEALQRQLVKYELPQELSNYNLLYREEVLGKTIVANNNETPEQLEAMKHELGLRSVVEAMLQEIPKTENEDIDDKDEYSSSFKYVGKAFNEVFEPRYIKDPASGQKILQPAESDCSSIFQELANNTVKSILNKYGSYAGFVDTYLKLPVGGEVLPTATAQHRSISVDYRAVKTYDNNTGFSIGFVQKIDENEYMFPLALFEITAYMEDSNRLPKGRTFASTYNSLIEPFCKEVRRTGLNINKIKLSAHEVEVIECSFLGSCVDEGQIMYLFKKLPESPERYFLLNEQSLGNKLFGTKYVLIGNNFQINYKGERLIIAPTEAPTFTSTEQIYQLIEEKNQYVIDPYPGYYAMFDIPNPQSVENNEYRRIIESYDELLPKTWNLGYTWNTELTESGVQHVQTQQAPTPQEHIQTTPPAEGSDVVDIFSGQPQGVFDQSEVESNDNPNATDENGLLLKPNFKNPIQVEQTAERLKTLVKENPNGQNIVSNYLLGHISMIHAVGEYLGAGMTYTTDPERSDSQIERHEIKTSAVERIVSHIKEDNRVFEARKEQVNRMIEQQESMTAKEDTMTENKAPSLETIENLYKDADKDKQEKLDMMLEFVAEFAKRF